MATKKKSLTAKEIFCGMPRLQMYFEGVDRKIKLLKNDPEKKEEYERLKKRRKELIDEAKYIKIEDYELMFYARRLRYLPAHYIKRSLAKLYKEGEELMLFLEKGKIPEEEIGETPIGV